MLDHPQFRDVITHIYTYLPQVDQWNLSRAAKAFRGDYIKLRDSDNFCTSAAYIDCGERNHQICLTNADLLGLRQNAKKPMKESVDYAFLGAVRGGHTALVRKLLERGAPTVIERALCDASSCGRKTIAMFLLSELRPNADTSTLRYGEIDVLVFGGHEVNIKQTINNAFLAAAATGHLAIVEMMLKNGASSIIGGLFAACTGIVGYSTFYAPRPYVFSEEHKKIVMLLAAKCGATQIKSVFIGACDSNNPTMVQNMLASGIVEKSVAMEGANRAAQIAYDGVYNVIMAHLRKK